jgi:hypothetical protein
VNDWLDGVKGQHKPRYEKGERIMDDQRFKSLELMLESAIQHMDIFRGYAKQADDTWAYHDDLLACENALDKARDLLGYLIADHAYEKQFPPKGNTP